MCLLKKITLYILNLSLLWLHMYVIFKSAQNAFNSSMYLLLLPDSVCGIKSRVEVDGMEWAHDSCLRWRLKKRPPAFSRRWGRGHSGAKAREWPENGSCIISGCWPLSGERRAVGKSGIAYPGRRRLAVGPQSVLGLGSAVCQLGVPSGHMALFWSPVLPVQGLPLLREHVGVLLSVSARTSFW